MNVTEILACWRSLVANLLTTLISNLNQAICILLHSYCSVLYAFMLAVLIYFVIYRWHMSNGQAPYIQLRCLFLQRLVLTPNPYVYEFEYKVGCNVRVPFLWYCFAQTWLCIQPSYVLGHHFFWYYYFFFFLGDHLVYLFSLPPSPILIEEDPLFLRGVVSSLHTKEELETLAPHCFAPLESEQFCNWEQGVASLTCTNILNLLNKFFLHKLS